MIVRRRIALTIVLAATCATPCLTPSLVHAADTLKGVASEVKIEKANQRENHERDVDQVALESQLKSIAKLKGLLKKYRRSRQEPILLAKLAELHVQTGAIRFRIAHGRAHRSQSGINLKAYRTTMKEAIATVGELITKYPGYEEIAQAYFTRGKAYEEIEDKKHAISDYLYLVKHWPDAEQAIPAHMSLAEFAIQDNEHARAISFLREVEKHPADPQYPFALYKLAWSYYNLKQIPEAMSYVELHVHYYDNERASPGTSLGSVSDDAFRENMLQDSTVFFMEGYEQKLSGYEISDALKRFRALDQGPTLGKMMLRYAKLLRSHGHDADLNAWKNQILAEESKRPESLRVLLTVYEHQQNKRRFPQLLKSAIDMTRLYTAQPSLEGWPDAQKELLDTASFLQEVIVKNKGADGVNELSATLAGIYDSFTKVVTESDPRIPRVHYNLAETLFEIRDFAQATEHYRWIVEHGKWAAKDKTAASVADSSLKAIASRYEFLREKKLIPGELKAVELSKDSTSSMDPRLSEWIGWVDEHIARTDDPIDNFAFEANRVLYSQSRVASAIARLKRFALKHPSSRFAIPSASLTLDTYIASQNWEGLHELARDFLKIKAWKKTDFTKRLSAVAADAFYKIVEIRFQARKYQDAIDLADDFLEDYAKSDRLADTLYIASSSALALADKKLANRYLTRLITEAPDTSNVRGALLNRATLREERYDFAEAAGDYAAYLESQAPKEESWSTKKEETFRSKALMLAWISGDLHLLGRFIESKKICHETCEKYEALQALALGQVDDKLTAKAFDRARKGASENQSIWAAVALEGSKHLANRDRLLAVKLLVKHWDDLDPLIQFSLVPTISVSIPIAFQRVRAGMAEWAPLRSNAKWITRRVEVIRETEVAATQAMKLPWARIRALVLSETSGLYLDLAQGLQSIPAPKDLSTEDRLAYEDTVRKIVIPFEEKGQEMLRRAFEIASRFAIEDSSYAMVSEPFFSGNPSQAKKLKPEIDPATPPAIDIAVLDRVDPDGDWDSLKPSADEPARRLKARWSRAVTQKLWGQVAFLLHEAQDKALIRKGVIGIVRAISMSAAGARAEALAQLEEAKPEFIAAPKKDIGLLLIAHYFHALSRERTRDLVKDLIEPTDETVADGKTKTASKRSPASTSDPLLILAARWSGVEIAAP